MIQTVNCSQFRDAFEAIRPRNFSYQGLEALYDYLEEVDEGMELDVIAICCEFTEYDSLADFQADYTAEDYETIDDIRDDTTVIEIPDTERFIVQQF